MFYVFLVVHATNLYILSMDVYVVHKWETQKFYNTSNVSNVSLKLDLLQYIYLNVFLFFCIFAFTAQNILQIKDIIRSLDIGNAFCSCI